MSKQVIFTSGSSNLNIVKKKGATIQRAVPGGSVSEVTPTSWIRFRKHRYVTSDPEEIKIIRDHIENRPRNRIKEIVSKTPQDILREKEAKALEATRELEEARKVVGEPELRISEATLEPQVEKMVYIEKCPEPDCDWIAESSTSQAQAKSKLRGHRATKHKSVK